MSSIRSILERLVYPIVGPRCKTKDIDDIEYKDGDNRCLVCSVYEQVDQALKEIEEAIDGAKPINIELSTNKCTFADGCNQYQSNLKELLK